MLDPLEQPDEVPDRPVIRAQLRLAEPLHLGSRLVVLALEQRLGGFEAVVGVPNELAGFEQVDVRRLQVVDTVVDAASERCVPSRAPPTTRQPCARGWRRGLSARP